MNDDLISRQAVLDLIHRFFTEEVDKIPTKKTEDGEVLVIRKCQPLFEMNKAICKRIKALSSVSPTQNCVENALDMRCDDAISRQAVQDYIAKYLSQYLYNDVRETVEVIDEYIGELPSVTPQEPKTGHWVMPVQDDGMSDTIYYQVRCSECGFDLDPQTWHQELHQYSADKYCPNCGCAMKRE